MGTNNVFATFDPTSLFAGEPPVRHRQITLLSGSNGAGTPLKRGALLGRITASDKYKPSVATANDGSQTPIAVLASDTDSSGGDVNCPAYFEGEFAFEMMTVDASWTAATLQAALRVANAQIYVHQVGTLG